MNLEAILAPLVPLNAWARCNYEQALGMPEARAWVYALKRGAIKDAMGCGICKSRIVKVERPCKTCKGTGTYEWVNWGYPDEVDYQDCRRCQATGKVTLRFLETEILGIRWHSPRPRIQYADWLQLDWEKAEETDWVPEQKPRTLGRIELIALLNKAERAHCEGKLLHWHNGWRGSLSDYTLHLGLCEQCFVCGRYPANTHWHFPKTIYRPGLKWEQKICDDCRWRAEKWPQQWPANLERHNRRRWITEDWAMRAPLPDLAYSSDVTEWLARRGIVIGRIPPTEYGWWRGLFVEIAAHRNGDSAIRITGDVFHGGYGSDAKLLLVPAKEISAFPVKLLAAGR